MLIIFALTDIFIIYYELLRFSLLEIVVAKSKPGKNTALMNPRDGLR